MKTFSTNLIAALLIGSLGLAGNAFACGGGGHGGAWQWWRLRRQQQSQQPDLQQ